MFMICFFILLLLEGTFAADIAICRNSVKDQSCVLSCKCPKEENVFFYKTNGQISGEGVCFSYNVCDSKTERYSVFRNQSGAYVNIPRLQRKRDEDYWYCEHGKTQSTRKKLTVFGMLSNLTIGSVPTHVTNAFTVTAVGNCVYPTNVSARLLPSQGTSNHLPKISFISNTTMCDSDEYGISISFNIKPEDFTGDVSFQVEVKYNDDKMQPYVSYFSNTASFSVKGSDSATIELYYIYSIPIVLGIASISMGAFYIQRFKKRHVKKGIRHSYGTENPGNGVIIPGGGQIIKQSSKNHLKLLPTLHNTDHSQLSKITTPKAEIILDDNVTGELLLNQNNEHQETENEIDAMTENKTHDERVGVIQLSETTQFLNERNRQDGKDGQEIKSNDDVTDELLLNQNNEHQGTENEINAMTENKTHDESVGVIQLSETTQCLNERNRHDGNDGQEIKSNDDLTDTLLVNQNSKHFRTGDKKTAMAENKTDDDTTATHLRYYSTL